VTKIVEEMDLGQLLGMIAHTEELDDIVLTQRQPVGIEALAAPLDWNGGSQIHNWRNHVGVRVQAIWDTFTDAQKIAIAMDAEIEADREDYE
jgi:hypothetical protein